MTRRANWMAFALIFLMALMANAQAAPTRESLLIGPGDLVHIHVFDTPELEQDARVTDAGEVPLLLAGNVKVSGLTPALAANEIEDVLKKKNLLLAPRVVVTVTQFATENVSVLGEVTHPGAYPIGTPQPVVNVLALAGGLTDMASRSLMIQRHDSQERVPYFLRNTPGATGAPQQDPARGDDTSLMVNPGDTVIVPRADVIYVLGDVGKPGGYAVTTNDANLSLLQLVARAGGTASSAVPGRTKLIRKSQNGYIESTVSLSDIQKGKTADIQLKADDVVYVPFSYLRNLATNSAAILAGVATAAIYHF